MIEAPNVNRYLNKPIDLQPTHIAKLWRQKPIYFLQDAFDVTLDTWQEEAIDLYMNNQRLGMIASKGPGKAQPVNLEISTPEGPKRFGDLKPGDYVFGEDGKPTKVLEIHPQGFKPNYEVVFDDGTRTHCCDEHLWKVRGTKEKRAKSWSVKSLRDIIDEGLWYYQGEQVHYPWQIPSQGSAEFNESDQTIDPYVMGFWLGDGSRTSGVISTEDQEVIDRIHKLGYETYVTKPKGKCTVVNVYGLRAKIRDLGLLDKYSYEKSIPEVYKYASVKQRIELLKGLMDSDGTIDKRDACCEFSTTSLELARDVQWLIRSLGGKSAGVKVKESYLNGERHRDCYRVRVTTRFNPFHLERKAMYWRAPSQGRYFCRTMKEVNLIGEEEMMCISVEDPNHCYLTSSFIVTHNTFALAMLGWHFFMTNYRPKIAALSITKDHLKSNLWAELLMWRERSDLCRLSTNDGAERITLKGHEGYSFIDARSFPKSSDQHQQASALAGLHSDNVAFLIDEAGMIPDAVLNTADAALSGEMSESKNAKLIVTANPEVPSGLLYKASLGQTIQKWAIQRVSGDPDDPKRAAKVSKDWAREQIAQYGKDDPWVLINVFGVYPKSGSNMLLSDTEVADSMKRDIDHKEIQNMQSRMGIDVARGGIDRSAFARRQGLKAYPIDEESSDKYGPELAGIAMLKQEKFKIERVFVDNTGGMDPR